jgi:hypothetical protein
VCLGILLFFWCFFFWGSVWVLLLDGYGIYQIMSTSVAIAQGYEYHIKYSSKKNGTQEKIRIKYLHKLKNVKNVKNDQCIHLLK